LSHRIALSKVLTNTFSGEPPSKRFVLVLRALLRHRWALLLAPSRTMGNLGTQIPFPVVVRRTSRNPNVPSTVVQWNSVSSAAFPMNKFGDLKNEPIRPGTFGQANAKAYAARKSWCNRFDARRDVFSWHSHRQRSVSARKCADTNRIDGLGCAG